MIAHRPCGACGELVDAQRGCQHWRPGGGTPLRPGRGPIAEMDKERRERQRERNRINQRACRERAARDVARLYTG